ncbi:MAG: PilX N-terminal domain-containing pilus assembly protein, partial [Burkholderiales bacterium]
MKTRIVRRRGRLRQRGVSIFVVLVMVLLTTLMMLWAGRTALFNELVTGNDSDYQRALEAA